MQAQAQKTNAASESVTLAFKRHILQKSSGFASEPMADLFRVNLLSQMLDRYDELREKGMGEMSSQSRVLYEFDDIAARMRDMGFEEIGPMEEEVRLSRWPQLGESEAARYIEERDEYLHRISLGVMLCTACVAPLMAFCGLSECFFGYAVDAANMLGLIGMFGMIGMGVYAMVTAVKPKHEKKIREGRFALSARLRRNLTQLREEVEAKARRRMGKGVAMIVTSLIPLFVGAAISEIWYSDAWPMIGLAGMFLMIGAGVYELVMADGEKKTMKRLLDEKE